MQTKNFVKDVYLLNYKLYNDAEIYNTCIVEYLSVAKDIITNSAKLYLYRLQNKSADTFKDCFESFDNITTSGEEELAAAVPKTNFLKLSTKLKDVKISTFENYNYLQNGQFYPNIGYSLYYTDEKNTKIALLETYLSSSYLPFLSKVVTRLICQWEIQSISFYKNFFLNTPRIIQNVGKQIFEFSDKKNVPTISTTVPQEKIIIVSGTEQLQKQQQKDNETVAAAAAAADKLLDEKTEKTTKEEDPTLLQKEEIVKEKSEEEKESISKEEKEEDDKKKEEDKKSNGYFGFLAKLKNMMWKKGKITKKEITEEDSDAKDLKNIDKDEDGGEIEILMKSVAENKDQEELVSSIIKSVHTVLLEQKTEEIEEEVTEDNEVKIETVEEQVQQQQEDENLGKFPEIPKISLNTSKLLAGDNLSSSKYYAYQTVINELYDNLNVNDDTHTLIQKCKKVLQIKDH